MTRRRKYRPAVDGLEMRLVLNGSAEHVAAAGSLLAHGTHVTPQIQHLSDAHKSTGGHTHKPTGSHGHKSSGDHGHKSSGDHKSRDVVDLALGDLAKKHHKKPTHHKKTHHKKTKDVADLALAGPLSKHGHKAKGHHHKTKGHHHKTT
jgi:hypothetical protein